MIIRALAELVERATREEITIGEAALRIQCEQNMCERDDLITKMRDALNLMRIQFRST